MNKQKFDELSPECKSYRTAVNKCMVTMMIFFLLFDVLLVIYNIFDSKAAEILPPVQYEVMSQLAYGTAYALSFMLPVFFFKKTYPKHEAFPLEAEPRLPKGSLRLAVIAIAITFTAAIMNNLIMTVLSVITNSTPDIPDTEINGAHSIILSFIVTALVPGFVEELLFRGVFLRNLLPYGKTTAIIISSLMFAMMHQNFYQFFYTFFAGIAFGYLFLKTGSIWCGVIAHAINNGLSVLTSEVSYAFLDDLAAVQFEYIVYLIVVLAAIFCFISLVHERNKPKELKKGSVFGSTEKVFLPSGTIKISDKDAVRHFFTPATIAVIVYSAFVGIQFLIMILQPVNG